ncbi:hypothetical protein GQ457_07G006050 [Hibiscus cannabinus]
MTKLQKLKTWRQSNLEWFKLQTSSTSTTLATTKDFQPIYYRFFPFSRLEATVTISIKLSTQSLIQTLKNTRKNGK